MLHRRFSPLYMSGSDKFVSLFNFYILPETLNLGTLGSFVLTVSSV